MFKAYDETAGVSLITAGATARDVPLTYGAKRYLKQLINLFFFFLNLINYLPGA